MYIIEGGSGLATREAKLFSGTRLRILKLLAKKPSYPKEIARTLGINEQQIYYHVRELKKSGLISVSRREDRGGAVAKIYELSSPSFFTRFGEWEKMSHIPKESGFLSPFIENGSINCTIITGSPDPHGPERARSRDLSYALDFAIFIGTFLTGYEKPRVAVDTKLRKSDLRQNLIVIGGPVTNSVAKIINPEMPLRFDRNKDIFSSATRKTYRNEDAGLIAKAPNPLDPRFQVLYVAGKRYSGTKAAILTFLTRFAEIEKNRTHVVQGYDMDGDGEIDEVRILE